MKDMSSRSLLSNLSIGSSMNNPSPAVRMERDLLERMVQERDEKITALQKTISLQKKFTEKVQGILDETRLKHKQEITRLKINIDSMTIERDLAQSQLRALTKEREKYKDTMFQLEAGVATMQIVQPVKDAANTANAPGNTKNPQSPTNAEANSPPRTPPTSDTADSDSVSTSDKAKAPTKIESAHALYLQSQLYQALHSISALQIQTSALKTNYDAVISSLQQDLTEEAEEKSRMEVELMSQLALLEREKGVMEGLLEENLRVRDVRLKSLEKKVRKYEGVDDSIEEEGSDGSDGEDDDDRSRATGDSLSTVDEMNEAEIANDSRSDPITETKEEETEEDDANNSNMQHEHMESLLEELEMLSEHSIKPTSAK